MTISMPAANSQRSSTSQACAGSLCQLAEVAYISLIPTSADLNAAPFGDRSKLDPVVPSLFRHLAHWPKYLAAFHVSLIPRFRDHSIATASNDLQMAMIRESAIVATNLLPLKRVLLPPPSCSIRSLSSPELLSL